MILRFEFGSRESSDKFKEIVTRRWGHRPGRTRFALNQWQVEVSGVDRRFEDDYVKAAMEAGSFIAYREVVKHRRASDWHPLGCSKEEIMRDAAAWIKAVSIDSETNTVVMDIQGSFYEYKLSPETFHKFNKMFHVHGAGGRALAWLKSQPDVAHRKLSPEEAAKLTTSGKKISDIDEAVDRFEKDSAVVEAKDLEGKTISIDQPGRTFAFTVDKVVGGVAHYTDVFGKKGTINVDRLLELISTDKAYVTEKDAANKGASIIPHVVEFFKGMKANWSEKEFLDLANAIADGDVDAFMREIQKTKAKEDIDRHKAETFIKSPFGRQIMTVIDKVRNTLQNMGMVFSSKRVSVDKVVGRCVINEDIDEFEKVAAEKINIDELKKKFKEDELVAEIKKRLGFDPGLKIKLEHGRRGSPIVDIDSDNIVDKSGPFSEVFKDVRVRNFGGEVGEDKEGEGIVAWIPVHISWVHKGGGTNGADWFTAWYDFGKDKWTFR